MAQDALISLSPVVEVDEDGTFTVNHKKYPIQGTGSIGPVVAAGTALMLIASTAYSLTGNSSVNNSDVNDKDYIEINFTNDNGTTTVIRINSNNFTNSSSMVIGRG